MARSGQPNIIVIYCDDLGYGELGCTGSEYGQTPHIDALAARGVRFTNWYSNSPVCSPSRASLMTGRYPQKAGVREILGGRRGAVEGLMGDQTTLATALKRLGYQTALVGKWHLGTRPDCLPEAHGFDDVFGFRSGALDYFSHVFYWDEHRLIHDLYENGKEVWRNGEYMTDILTERAVEVVRTATSPFFLYLAYNAPHWPLHAPAKYLDRFKNVPPAERIMAAMISAVDDGVGAVVEALREKAELENTLLFFSSDNGPSNEFFNWMDGSTEAFTGSSAGIYKGCKASLFDGGIHMPAIFSWPSRIPLGRLSEEVCAMMDVFPTCIEAAGGSVPDVDGRSLMGVLTSDASSPHDTLFWEYHGQFAARQGPWKLVLNGLLDFDRQSADAVHLSNIVEDPSEKINLAGQYPEIVKDLTDRICRWRTYVGLA
ncbi:MAG: sulfatase-like hydrolase/transferase [Armatimonadetes bacterium]|nr:sulfatase-like hydrolase/transferase [Armatimonadota bacterium]